MAAYSETSSCGSDYDPDNVDSVFMRPMHPDAQLLSLDLKPDFDANVGDLLPTPTVERKITFPEMPAKPFELKREDALILGTSCKKRLFDDEAEAGCTKRSKIRASSIDSDPEKEPDEKDEENRECANQQAVGGDEDSTGQVAELPEPLTELLFKKTLQYIQDLNGEEDAVKDVMQTISDKKSFVKTIYEKSKSTESTDELFWRASKLLTVGAAHSIELGNTKGEITKQQLTPVQFGGFKGAVLSGCSRYYQDIGEYGERWVGDQINLTNIPYEAPGKICKMSFPVSSTTPDYIFLTGLNDCPEDAPITFEQGAIIGVGEVKTSSMNLSTRPVWKKKDATVREIMNEKPAMIRNLFRWRRDKKLTPARIPIKLRDHGDLCMRIANRAEDSTRWSMWYYDDPEDESVHREEVDFDRQDPNNDGCIKLFSSSIGRQMLCEAMSVLDYVDKGAEELEIRAFFPSVIDKGSPRKYSSWDDGEAEEKEEGEEEEEDKQPDRFSFLTAFSLNCTMKVSIADLRELDRVTNQHLAEAMYSVAKSRYLM